MSVMFQNFDIFTKYFVFYNVLNSAMYKLSDNYYLRKCFFKREQVPTQSVMIKHMTPPLASVYFKSMSSKLKVLAGLEPPMKGGGSDWYVPPDELLKGRAVMQPIKNEYLKKLGFNGINFFGEKLLRGHRREMQEEQRQALLESDEHWKQNIDLVCKNLKDELSNEAAVENSLKLQEAFHEFSCLYSKSINEIESLLFSAASEEIERTRQDTFQKMSVHYKTLLKQQATMLYDTYTEKLAKEKVRLKQQFIDNIDETNTILANQIHDINVEKHVAVEKLRNLLECQNLACQAYVALKERQECEKQIQLSRREHRKVVKKLKEQIALTDFEIKLAMDKEKKRQEFINIWKKKVCHVVKKLQMFVKYCLTALPDHADFFINMEKLALLQLNEVMENPSVESIFLPESNEFHTPVAQPHPYYLCCDRGFKPQVEQRLCPKHCTSSATQLPVIIVNKRCIYAACDNFEMYSEKVKQFLDGRRGDDADFEDDHDYTYNIPVKYTSTEQLLELKLESSLMQVLQSNIPNVNNVPTECCVCRLPHCFCSFSDIVDGTRKLQPKIVVVPAVSSISSGKKIETRCEELHHEREPKWERYMNYAVPKKCKCAKMAKKHLEEHLPVYMTKRSKYERPFLPNYEPCSLDVLKKLVKKARGKPPPPKNKPIKVESKKRDVSTQYSDQEFDFLCTCFSDDELATIIKDLDGKMIPNEIQSPGHCDLVDGNISDSRMSKDSTFVVDRAWSLRRLMDRNPEIKEIFRKSDCNFD